MRSLLGSLAAATCLLLYMSVTSGAAAASAPASPSCAEGPTRVGDTTYGTPCADVIVAPTGVETVRGGGGDDTILGANSGPVAAVTGSCETGCHLEVGSQTFEGGPGNDVVFGDRGNDTLRGNAGNDRLYGGIGDDWLEGGPGNDLLSGGFGAEKKIDGGEGDDYVRGDATIDHIFDSGGGIDTLSFSTGVTPGFSAEVTNPTEAANFPGENGERGIWLKLGQGGNNALDGEPSLGGGNDEVQPGVFERIIGTPFADYIVGSSGDEQIYGGGGAAVIKGEGGNDLLNGGADGDYLEGGGEAALNGEGGSDNCVGTVNIASCEGTAAAVEPREITKVSVGETTGATGLTQVYAVGGESADEITATFNGSTVTVSIAAGRSFNADLGGCDLSNPITASCPVSGLLDSVLLAGMAGNDTILATNFPDGVGVVASGGGGEDTLTGGPGEDVLVDGPGDFRDVLAAGAGDDALTHNGGEDLRDGGEGSDLFLSVALCQGESIVGGTERVGAPVPDRDNASWARLGGVGVDARIDQGSVREVVPGGGSRCASGAPDTLSGIEDLEGSNQDDYLVGDGGNNQLLGHKGADSYFGLAAGRTRCSRTPAPGTW